ncbi:MAG: F420-0:Gamma-glutamyl ligase [Geitlerinemataceae cyanobacterium]
MAIATGIAVGATVAGAVGLGLLGFEAKYRQRQGNDLQFRPGSWKTIERSADRVLLVGETELYNATDALEIMIPEVSAELTLLGGGNLHGVESDIRITPQHPDAPARDDGYWFAYIVKAKHSTGVKISIELTATDAAIDLEKLKTVWLRFNYMTYGPAGRIPQIGHAVIPLNYPDPAAPPNWLDRDRAEVFPVKTHLLTHLDDPVEVVKKYVLPHSKPGDIVTIGETPIAIMQQRWRYPADVKPGWLAKRLCYFFLPTSSLATVCGLQTLVDVSGAWRVGFAFAIGAVAKVFGRPGVFYQLAGEQARLIDDVTGTLPPYDRFIVLGPHDPQGLVERIERETGLVAAVVDVNDLQAVKVLAASSPKVEGVLQAALRSNPAGNADEQTPVVLVRPKLH